MQASAALFALIALAGVSSADLYPPLQGVMAPTSSFLEHRSFRFHSGVDFSVGGRVGVPYFAVDDGYIWLVRTSPYGYGKVVYVRLRNGYTAIYAHLSGFPEDVERVVREEQLRQQAYSVDLYFTPRQFPVSRGDLVGYSGNTGIGVPHMHFELRDPSNSPVNPFSHGLRFSDTVPPRMDAIAFIPLDAWSRVNGRTEPVILRLRQRNGEYTVAEAPVLRGRVGVALAAHDRTQHGRYRVGLYGTDLELDGREVFRRRYDRYSFPEQHMSVFDRNYPLLLDSKGRYYNLFLAVGNRLPFYGDLQQGAGVLACACSTGVESESLVLAGHHELRITGSDFAGNTAVAVIPITSGRVPEFAALSRVSAGDTVGLAVVAADCTDFVRLAAWVSTDDGRTWDTLAPAAGLPDTLVHRVSALLPLPSDSVLVRLTATDTLGLVAETRVRPRDLDSLPEIGIEPVWGRNWCELQIMSSRALETRPVLEATWVSEVQVPIPARELSPGFYEADVVPDDTWPRDYRLRVFGGPGTPTIVSCWSLPHAAAGAVELLSVDGEGSATYRGTVAFGGEFPDSGAVRLVAGGIDTSLVVRGRLVGLRVACADSRISARPWRSAEESLRSRCSYAWNVSLSNRPASLSRWPRLGGSIRSSCRSPGWHRFA